ncbi:hypothetical protein COCOBI_10-1000 [Coccomyxa sp. Obi]|nr:hypothetical protein COCOBI_10-1000 [Coccomyxa sp. Obi]
MAVPDAPLDKGNPMASNIQPYAQPPSHAAHVDSADSIFDDIIDAGGIASFAGRVIAATYYYAREGAQAAGDELPAVAGDVLPAIEMAPVELGAEAGAAVGGGEVGAAVGAGVTADSVPLDLQDGDVATTDASIKAAQNKGISNPVQSAMQAGKKQNPSAQAPLTAFQNILLLAPQQAVMAKAPTALPSAIQAGLATPVKSQPAGGGRKMLQRAPDCCNTYIVKPGDTLASIATAYGQPTNGVHIMQARTAVIAAANGLSGDVAPGQTIMLPCGRLLSYINAYNVGAIAKGDAINAAAG